MIDSKSKYKKVNQEQFGERLTVDGQVFGIRPQKLIKRNEDVVFLAEAKGVVDNVHDGTILLDYPFYSDEVKFPTPPLASFVDTEKFQNFDVSSHDVHMKTGGANPDTQGLRSQWQNILDNRNMMVQQLDNQLTSYEEQLKEQKQKEKASLQTRKQAEQAKFATIDNSYQNALSSIDKYVESEEQKLEIRQQQADAQYASKNISKAEYLELVAQIEYDKQELQLTRYKKTQDAKLTKEGGIQQTKYTIYDIDFQISDIDNKYKQLYDDKDADLKAQLSAYDEVSYWPQVEPIYSASNFGAGIADNASERQLEKDIANLSVYSAVDGMYKSYAWNLGKSSTEYMDRLFADWEKLQFKKISNYSFKQHCGGVIEHYRGDMGDGYKWKYNNFKDGDYVFYDFDYDNDPYDNATYDILDGTIDVRLGGRYDVGKIKNVYAVVQAYGVGVDGYGFGYKLVKLSRKGEVDDASGTRLNLIEDEYYTTIEGVDKTYKAGVEAAQKSHDEALANANSVYEDEVKAIDEDESQSIADAKSSYMENLRQLTMQYNTIVYKGEDASQVMTQIQNTVNAMDKRIAQIEAKSKEDRKKSEQKRSQAVANADEQLNKELTRLKNVKDDAYSQAGTNMNNEKTALFKQIDDEYRAMKDEITNTYDQALEAATEKHDTAARSLAEQESNLWDSLMESWKSAHEGQEPSDWSDPEVQEHFKPYQQMLEEHTPMYNSLAEQLHNETCDAEVQYAKDEAELMKFNEDGRELWQFDGTQCASIASFFSKKDQTYGAGEKSARISNIKLLVAEMDYEWKTGVEYKDYETEDRNHREQTQDNTENG